MIRVYLKHYILQFTMLQFLITSTTEYLIESCSNWPNVYPVYSERCTKLVWLLLKHRSLIVYMSPCTVRFTHLTFLIMHTNVGQQDAITQQYDHCYIGHCWAGLVQYGRNKAQCRQGKASVTYNFVLLILHKMWCKLQWNKYLLLKYWQCCRCSLK